MEKIYILLFIVWVLFSVSGCTFRKNCATGRKTVPPKNTPANAHMNHSDFSTLIERFENPERDKWQKPEKVIATLGDLNNKQVIDIGAGTGYFSIRLAKAGAEVIAADVDDRFSHYLQERLDTTDVAPGSVTPKQVQLDDPMIAGKSMDLALIVNTYHHIDHRTKYFHKVHEGLKPGGKLVVIDFKKEETPMGPPIAIKVSPEQVKEELFEAGFRQFHIDKELLPYQYLIIAE